MKFLKRIYKVVSKYTHCHKYIREMKKYPVRTKFYTYHMFKEKAQRSGKMVLQGFFIDQGEQNSMLPVNFNVPSDCTANHLHSYQIYNFMPNFATIR